MTNRRSAERLVQIRPPTQELSLISATSLRKRKKQDCVAMNQDDLVLMSKAADAKFVRAKVTEKLKCIFCRMFMLSAKNVTARVIIKRPWKLNIKDKNIAQVLAMSIEESYQFFKNIPPIHQKLETMVKVGLNYMKLGQPATTLSGGEAQRIKLATELARKSTSQTLYILDEPTTGLHFDDISKLLAVLHEFVSRGNTVLVIEHNPQVIKTANWIIDLGPEGGEKGGYIVAEGQVRDIIKNRKSYTGRYLK